MSGAEFGIFSTLLLALLSGCALLPNTIAPELEHQSHATQHWPFTDHPTSYGAELIGLDAHWSIGHASIDVSESYNLNRCYEPQYAYGDIQGPREIFDARIGYAFTVRP